MRVQLEVGRLKSMAASFTKTSVCAPLPCPTARTQRRGRAGACVLVVGAWLALETATRKEGRGRRLERLLLQCHSHRPPSSKTTTSPPVRSYKLLPTHVHSTARDLRNLCVCRPPARFLLRPFPVRPLHSTQHLEPQGQSHSARPPSHTPTRRPCRAHPSTRWRTSTSGVRPAIRWKKPCGKRWWRTTSCQRRNARIS